MDFIGGEGKMISGEEQGSEKRNEAALWGELKQLWNQLIEKNPDNFGRFVERGVELKAIFPEDYDRYKLYHLLIGSTPYPERSPLWDFTGDYSVEKFLREFKG